MEIQVPEEFAYLFVRNAERPIVKIPDPVLRKKASAILEITPKTGEIIRDMIQMMEKAHGIGLAAPQIGLSQRIIVVSPTGDKPLALINPEIVERSGSFLGQEGCLSIPGLYGDVERSKTIVVEGYDVKGKAVAYEMEDLAARVVQHEIDHLDGILFTDTVIQETLHWAHPGSPDDQDAE
jgi:peptide deformylase